MLFNSVQFFIFFPIVTFLYFVSSQKVRTFILIIASCLFYIMFIPKYLLVILLLVVIDYWAGLFIFNAKNNKRKYFLIISIVTNLSILCFFKYFDFLSINLFKVTDYLHVTYLIPSYLRQLIVSIENQNILLPLGISFHTFQSMSYTIEVYRKRIKPEKNIFIYALYVLFYPQLVAGPIERPYNLLPQLHKKQTFDSERITSGLRLMLWGFFKKMVVADRLAALVNPIYNVPSKFDSTTLVIATYFFAFQIYADFSGYTDIARGAARVMGFKLMLNFNLPYIATSIKDFWKRWHISLSTWFRDYLYIPLGGSKVARWKWLIIVMIVFSLSGLWHGSSGKYLIWGAYNGLLILLSVLVGKFIDLIKLRILANNWYIKIIQIIIIFNLVSLGWIFFRARTLFDAVLIIKKIFIHPEFNFDRIIHFSTIPSSSPILNFGIDSLEILISLIAIIILITVETLVYRFGLRKMFTERSLLFRWAVYYAIILFIIFFAAYESYQFIYFQF